MMKPRIWKIRTNIWIKMTITMMIIWWWMNRFKATIINNRYYRIRWKLKAIIIYKNQRLEKMIIMKTKIKLCARRNHQINRNMRKMIHYLSTVIIWITIHKKYLKSLIIYKWHILIQPHKIIIWLTIKITL